MSFLDDVAGMVGGALKLVGGPINPLVDTFESVGKQLGIPPQLLDAVELIAGAVTGNPALAAAGAGDVLSSLRDNPAAKTEYNVSIIVNVINSPGQQGTGTPLPINFPFPGYAPQVVSPEQPEETSKSNEEKYRDALRTVNNHWGEVRHAGGPLAPGLTHQSLEKIANDPTASPELKQAAKFFLDHPEYFDKLDVGEHGGDPDGFADKDDLDAALRRANASVPETAEKPADVPCSAPPPPPAAYSPADEEAKDELRRLLLNKGMPMEAKIMLFATALATKLDNSIDKQLSKVAEKVKQQEAAGSDESKQSAANGSLQLEMQKLNLVMQLEKTLLEVASNAIANYNQMNSKIAGNLRA